jgi:hypothetical protein
MEAINLIPIDVLGLILRWLRPLQIIRLELVCKRIHRLLRNLSFWELMKPQFTVHHNDPRSAIMVLRPSIKNTMADKINLKILEFALGDTAGPDAGLKILVSSGNLAYDLSPVLKEINTLGYLKRTIVHNVSSEVKYMWFYTCSCGNQISDAVISDWNGWPCCKNSTADKKWKTGTNYTISFYLVHQERRESGIFIKPAWFYLNHVE